jgi:hypothetical protein
VQKNVDSQELLSKSRTIESLKKENLDIRNIEQGCEYDGLGLLAWMRAVWLRWVYVEGIIMMVTLIPGIPTFANGEIHPVQT